MQQDSIVGFKDDSSLGVVGQDLVDLVSVDEGRVVLEPLVPLRHYETLRQLFMQPVLQMALLYVARRLISSLALAAFLAADEVGRGLDGVLAKIHELQGGLRIVESYVGMQHPLVMLAVVVIEVSGGVVQEVIVRVDVLKTLVQTLQVSDHSALLFPVDHIHVLLEVRRTQVHVAHERKRRCEQVLLRFYAHSDEQEHFAGASEPRQLERVSRDED